jgi:hypothetical protein
MSACDTKEKELAEHTIHLLSLTRDVMSMMLATHGVPHYTLSRIQGTLTAHYLHMQAFSPRHVFHAMQNKITVVQDEGWGVRANQQ